MKTVEISSFKIEKGAFASVLIDTLNKKAFKLFKSYEHPDLDGTGKEDTGSEKTNTYRRKVFETENEAYLLAQGSPLLKMHTPTYFGLLDIKTILDNNQDITHQYLSGCCLALEYIEGRCEKLGNLDWQPDRLEQLERSLNFRLSNIYEEFTNVGIHYTKDASVIINDKEFKIIDFATEDPVDFEPINGM